MQGAKKQPIKWRAPPLSRNFTRMAIVGFKTKSHQPGIVSEMDLINAQGVDGA
jgi:hypothetical protein